MAARILSLALVAAIVSPLAAADKNVKNVKADKKGNLAQLTLPKGVELSAEQQAKFKPIQDEAAAKLAELQKQIDVILTPERKAAQAEAMKKAKAEGKDKKEASQAAQAALGLKEDEAAKLKQLSQESGAILKDAREKLSGILTEEQKAKLAELKKGKGVDKNKKPGKGETPAKGAQPIKGSTPDKGAQAAPVKGSAPDKGAQPVKGSAPDKGVPLKGSAPDKGAQPVKGSAPDKGAQAAPVKGSAPDKGAQPVKGSAPDKGVPVKGSAPDKGAQPVKGSAPDKGGAK
jgi:hypothetical protein